MKPTTTNYQRLIEQALKDKTGDPDLTIAGYLLQCASDKTTDAAGAAFLGVPLGTYREWMRAYVVRVARLRVDADHGNQLPLPDMPAPVEA